MKNKPIILLVLFTAYCFISTLSWGNQPVQNKQSQPKTPSSLSKINKAAIREAAKKHEKKTNEKMKKAVKLSKVSLDTPITLPSDI